MSRTDKLSPFHTLVLPSCDLVCSGIIEYLKTGIKIQININKYFNLKKQINRNTKQKTNCTNLKTRKVNLN